MIHQVCCHSKCQQPVRRFRGCRRCRGHPRTAIELLNRLILLEAAEAKRSLSYS